MRLHRNKRIVLYIALFEQKLILLLRNSSKNLPVVYFLAISSTRFYDGSKQKMRKGASCYYLLRLSHCEFALLRWLKNTVEAIKQRQHLVKADFEIAIQLANELDFLFDKGNFDERRLLCETVFRRIYVDGDRINKVELNSPFSLIATKAEGSGTVLSGGAYWTERRTFALAFRLAT